MVSSYNKESYYQESAMPRRGINGGPGRTRTFDLPIMRPAGRVLKSTEAVVCRRLSGVPIPVSLPLARSRCVFTRIHLGGLVQ